MSVGQLHGLGDTVGVAAVVDVPGHAPRHGGVHHPVVVQPEHVDATVLILVVLLSDISQIGSGNNQKFSFHYILKIFCLPYDLSDVLDDHLSFFKISSSIESKPLDPGSSKDDILSPFLLHLPILRCFTLDKVLAVGANGLKTNKERNHLLGSSVKILLSPWSSLEIVDSLDMSSKFWF